MPLRFVWLEAQEYKKTPLESGVSLKHSHLELIFKS
jgi:hypothetical protein